MTAKEFFKSTAFKCICVLLCIVLICGILLTICNALFAVSEQDRLDRAISKIYGTTVTYKSDEEVNADYAQTSAYTVNKIYPLLDEHEGEYLLNITGNGGFSNGTVTCWVVGYVNDENGNKSFGGITKVSIDSNSGQSYISYVTDSALNSLIAKQEDENFTSFNTTGISTGATFSLGAIANCLNGASDYLKSVYCGYVSPFADYEYADYIDDTTTITVSGTDVTYNIVTISNGEANAFNITITVGSDGTIKTYDITFNGSTYGYDSKMSAIANNMEGQTLATLEAHIAGNGLSTGATKSNTLCVYSGLFATANYELALSQYAEGGNAE